MGAWLRARGTTVSVFYLSNVEDYLRLNGSWDAFCRNVTSLPVGVGSQFIRRVPVGRARSSARVGRARLTS